MYNERLAHSRLPKVLRLGESGLLDSMLNEDELKGFMRVDMDY